MTQMLTLDDLDLSSLKGVKTFVRVDFNVPLDQGKVMDDTRLVAALGTLRELRAVGAKVILASHCGRPKGEPDPVFSLKPAAERLSELLGEPVAFASDCVGEAATEVIETLADGGICLLENLRFHPGEKSNDPAFADALAALCDAYVGNAFGTAHRAHASVVGVAERVSRKAAGRLLVAEVQALGKLLSAPQAPFAGVVGGAKIEGKVDTLVNLLPRLDRLVLGGGMANTFLVAQGFDLKDSLFEPDRLEMARDILQKAAEQGVEVFLPQDLVVTDDLGNPSWVETVAVNAVPDGGKAVDIGEASRQAIREPLASAGTVFWNGPMGVFEMPPFDQGTVAAGQAVASSSGFTVIGGGETVAAAKRAGVADSLSHISTGGGASLEFLAGKQLPGVLALQAESGKQ